MFNYLAICYSWVQAWTQPQGGGMAVEGLQSPQVSPQIVTAQVNVVIPTWVMAA